MISKRLISGILLQISIFCLIFSFVFILVDSELKTHYDSDHHANGALKSDFRNIKFYNLTGTSIYVNDLDPEYNWSKTAQESEWCTGSGTLGDPYIIENVTIDMQNSQLNCLTINNSNRYFIIQNCQFFHSNSSNVYFEGGGIMLWNVSNGLITRNKCLSNTIGIISVGENNLIKENSVANNELYGISCWGESNTISNNTVSNNTIGIGVSGFNNKISLNKVNESKMFGIYLMGGMDFTISKNSVSHSNRTGIYVEICLDSNIIENTCNNNRIGIMVKIGSNNEISKNECTDNKIHGIYIDGVNDRVPNRFVSGSEGFHSISENQVNNNSYGITLNYTDFNLIVNNIAINNELSGIELYESDYINILRNQIDGNYYGINIHESLNNKLRQNLINYNFYGISLTSSHGHQISNNSLNQNEVCMIENNNCIDNIYEDNDCNEVGNKGIGWIVLTVMTTTLLLGLTLIIAIFWRHKKSREKLQ